MYIVYDRNQWRIFGAEGHVEPKDYKAPSPILPAGLECEPTPEPEPEPVPEFKPAWLVRVSDMQVVPGSSVNGHYWALSYSWNQSGEIIQAGEEEYYRIDEGKHQIITSKTYLVNPEDPFDKEKKIDTSESTPEYFTFDDLIQQICNDFDVEYIWYDQKCIDQNDHDAKMQEIKQMHLIYSNAYYTLALVPELTFSGDQSYELEDIADIDKLPNSQWAKRIWTLEEAYKSKRLLLVGNNVHMWTDRLNFSREDWTYSKVYQFLDNISRDKWRASTALWYARERMTTKAHDRVFALVNIFPELKQGIDFNYRQQLIDLMVRFYGLLAQKDQSILYFGAHHPSVHADLPPDRRKEASLLPSWTGAAGVHVAEDIMDSSDGLEAVCNYTVEGRLMHMTTTLIPIQIELASSITSPDSISYDTFDAANADHIVYTKCGVPFRRFGPVYKSHSWNREDGDLIESSGTALTFVRAGDNPQDYRDQFQMNRFGLNATHALPLKEESNNIVNTLLEPSHVGAVLSLTEECSECFILSEIHFHADFYDIKYHVQIALGYFRCHPVVRKDEDHYKLIGLCIVSFALDFDPSLEIKQTIVIE